MYTHIVFDDCYVTCAALRVSVVMAMGSGTLDSSHTVSRQSNLSRAHVADLNSTNHCKTKLNYQALASSFSLERKKLITVSPHQLYIRASFVTAKHSKIKCTLVHQQNCVAKSKAWPNPEYHSELLHASTAYI